MHPAPPAIDNSIPDKEHRGRLSFGRGSSGRLPQADRAVPDAAEGFENKAPIFRFLCGVLRTCFTTMYREVRMATKSAVTFKKKEREEAKRRKRLAKEAKKTERRENKVGKESIAGWEDPDIAGIVPGPQPKDEG